MTATALPSPTTTVRVSIVNLDRGYTVWRWLCDACTKLATALRPDGSEGWKLKVRKDPPHPLPCDGCGTLGGTGVA